MIVSEKIMLASASIVSAMIDRSSAEYSIDEVIKMTTDIYNGIVEPKNAVKDIKTEDVKTEEDNPLFKNKLDFGIEPTFAATVTPDYIISLEDGKPYKTLGRHLAKHGLTPEQYRERWNLPHNYPMVSENYSKRRVEIAKAFRLGHHRRR